MGKHLLERLSARQCQLLELVGQDLTASKVLAVDTGLSPGTIDNLLQSAAKALEVHGRVAAAQRYKELSAPSDGASDAKDGATTPAVPTAPDPLPLLPANTPPAVPAVPKRRHRLFRPAITIIGTALALLTMLALMFQAFVATRGYSSCNMARLVGAAPIPKDQPGYRLALDRDRDGVACE